MMQHRPHNSRPRPLDIRPTYALPAGDEAHRVLQVEIQMVNQNMDMAFHEIEIISEDLEDVKKLKRYLLEGGKLLWAFLLFGLAFAGKLDWGAVQTAVLGAH